MEKRIAVIAVVVVLAATGVVFACGGESNKGTMNHGMTERKVVATSDGGIVIVSGNKITKYDRNLKLINEAELSGMMKKGGCGKCQMKGMEHKMKDQVGENKGNLNSKDTQGQEAHH